jgi:pilus assembly protein Flp/PilA
MREFFRVRRDNEDGATAIEYGLLAGLISVAIVGAATAVGANLVTVFNDIVTALPG